jgi:hypothetical protein
MAGDWYSLLCICTRCRVQFALLLLLLLVEPLYQPCRSLTCSLLPDLLIINTGSFINQTFTGIAA